MNAINQAFEAEIPRLRRYALKLTRNSAIAEDLVQECLVRGLEKQHLWQEGTNLRAWLCTILHNQYVNEIRRTRREGSPVELNDTEERLTFTPCQDHRLQLRDMQRALQNLPVPQRAAVLLIGLEGMQYEKVAKAAGVPVGTIRSRLSRGRQKLKSAA